MLSIGNTCCGATVISYVILPSVQSEMIATRGPHQVSYLSSSFVDSSVLRSPNAQQMARFRAAMSSLNLNPDERSIYHPLTWPTSMNRPTDVPDGPRKYGEQIRGRDDSVIYARQCISMLAKKEAEALVNKQLPCKSSNAPSQCRYILVSSSTSE